MPLTLGALADAYVTLGTLMYARIHMGIPLTLYDVCKHKGPSMISKEFTLGKMMRAELTLSNQIDGASHPLNWL